MVRFFAVLVLAFAPMGFAQDTNSRLAVLETKVSAINESLTQLEGLPQQIARIASDVRYLSEQSRQNQENFFRLYLSPVITGIVGLFFGAVVLRKNGNGHGKG